MTTPKPGPLNGGHVVVTGAASGIGAAIAHLVAARGACVTCADIDTASLAGVVGEITRAGGQAVAVGCDITDHDQVLSLLASARTRFGDVSGVAANAGGAAGPGRPFLELTPADWSQMIDRNLTAAFHTGLVFGRDMAARRGGSIVFTTSNTAEIAIAGLAHYAAAKGGVRQLMRTMAVELAPLGVRVNAVAPGATRTHGNQDRLDDPAVLAGLAGKIPLGRVARPEEVAGAVAYLLSAEASYTTGATIAVDGGYTCP